MANDAITAPTRERLRRSAIALFSERGFEAVTIGDIEAHSGLAPRAGSFYRHYRSKQEIFDACLAALTEDMASFFDLSRLFPLSDVRAELLVIGRMIITFAEERKEFRMLIRQAAQRDPRLLDALREVNRDFYDRTLISWLDRVLGEHGKSGVSARKTAALIFGPVLYQMLQRDVGSKPFDLADDALIECWADFWSDALTTGDASALPAA